MREDLPQAHSPVPLYHQVFSILSQRIKDGTYAVGARFSTEDQLVAEFGVSRATVRQALDEMDRAGLITRRQGRGTFVATRLPAVGMRFRGSLADLVREAERAVVGDVEIHRSTVIPARVAGVLRLPRPVATTVARTLVMDGELFAYALGVVPDAVAAHITEAELHHPSLLHVLARRGVPVERARQSIRAEVADTLVTGRLRVDFGTPVLHVERTLVGAGGEPVAHTRCWYRGDVYEHMVTFDIEAGSPDAINSHFA